MLTCQPFWIPKSQDRTREYQENNRKCQPFFNWGGEKTIFKVIFGKGSDFWKRNKNRNLWIEKYS